MAVTVRPARGAEVERVGDLVVDTYVGDGLVRATSGYVRVLRDAGARASQAVLLVAVDDDDGALLGTVTFAPSGSAYAQMAAQDEAEFRMLAVVAAARRRGIARLLVDEVVRRSRQAGARAVVLSSSTEMRAAHRLYESMGFVRAPERDWSPPEDEVQLIAYRLALD